MSCVNSFVATTSTDCCVMIQSTVSMYITSFYEKIVETMNERNNGTRNNNYKCPYVRTLHNRINTDSLATSPPQICNALLISAVWWQQFPLTFVCWRHYLRFRWEWMRTWEKHNALISSLEIPLTSSSPYTSDVYFPSDVHFISFYSVLWMNFTTERKWWDKSRRTDRIYWGKKHFTPKIVATDTFFFGGIFSFM